MNEHSIFYYPYASFRDDQVPLLKAAAQQNLLWMSEPVVGKLRTVTLFEKRRNRVQKFETIQISEEPEVIAPVRSERAVL